MLATVAAILMSLVAQTVPDVTPQDDLVITESCRIVPGEYRILDGGEPGVIRIRGEHLLVVLEGVTLIGSAEGAAQDERAGTGIVIEGNSNIVYGGKIHGYRVGMQIDGGEGHWIMRTEFAHGFAQRLKSTAEAEDGADWLWPHENDEGQWAKNYGAGIRARNAKDLHLVGLSGRAQQNGMLLENVTGSLVRGCDFSFLSGWGLAMWRSSDNRIERNAFDWCVRGYSHGVYDRGQDSAGILVFEQCSRNVFRGNSAVHSGDGFFLYAGNESLKKTGEGGCNDNQVIENDFSFAVANGIEATFSTGNVFRGNLLEGCNYGIWAGYSRKCVFEQNTIRKSVHAGIAIEHGSENVIRDNEIEDSKRGVMLWWDEDKDLLASPWAENNRTDSADTEVTGNRIRGGEAGLSVRDSARIRFTGNRVEGATKAVSAEGECPDLVDEPAEGDFTPKAKPWTTEPGRRRGREFIIMGEWGPYDFGEPLAWPRRTEGGRRAEFVLLGLKGRPEVEETSGEVDVALRLPIDADPLVVVTPRDGAAGLLPFAFKVKTGEKTMTGQGVLLVAEWRVRFWKWDEDPREDPEAFAALLATEPATETVVPELSFPFKNGGPGEEVGADRFASVAETTIRFAAGAYELSVTSDDGVRVLVDGSEVLANWTHHGPTEDRARLELSEGEHRIRVEHFEIDGWAWLALRLRPVRQD